MTGRRTSSIPLTTSPRGSGRTNKDATRPGGYVATGGHGGILGAAGHDGPPLLHYLPTARHTWRSEVNLTSLPSEVGGVRQEGSRIETVRVAIKEPDGKL